MLERDFSKRVRKVLEQIDNLEREVQILREPCSKCKVTGRLYLQKTCKGMVMRCGACGAVQDHLKLHPVS